MDTNRYGVQSGPQFKNVDTIHMTHVGSVNPYSKFTANSNAFNYRSDSLKKVAAYGVDTGNTLLGANASGMTKNPFHPTGESDDH